MSFISILWGYQSQNQEKKSVFENGKTEGFHVEEKATSLFFFRQVMTDQSCGWAAIF